MFERDIYTIHSTYREDMRIKGFQFGKGEKSACIVGAARGNEIQQMYIMTKFHTATSDTLSILGALRLIVAKELDIIPEGKWNFLWITEMPFFEYDEETGEWLAMNHPFTMPMEFSGK